MSKLQDFVVLLCVAWTCWLVFSNVAAEDKHLPMLNGFVVSNLHLFSVWSEWSWGSPIKYKPSFHSNRGQVTFSVSQAMFIYKTWSEIRFISVLLGWLILTAEGSASEIWACQVQTKLSLQPRWSLCKSVFNVEWDRYHFYSHFQVGGFLQWWSFQWVEIWKL